MPPSQRLRTALRGQETAVNGSTHMVPRERWLVVGAGSFGTAITRVMTRGETEITLAARSPEHVAAMRSTRSNERFFPGIGLPEDLQLLDIDAASQRDWDGIIIAVPTSAVADALTMFRSRAPVFVSLAKGLAPDGRRISEVASDIVDPGRFVVLSGPNIAAEIMQDLPTAAVVAGADTETLLTVQRRINSVAFRVYANLDVVGVELAGATKNVIAIAAGVLAEAGFGDNGIGALIARGIWEMARLGIACGATLQTYLGLAGVGDLVTTCSSVSSRNRRAGALLARGFTAGQAMREIGQVVEGLRTAPVVVEMARSVGEDLHICEAVADVAEHGTPLPDVVQSLMSRAPEFEFESDRLATGQTTP